MAYHSLWSSEFIKNMSYVFGIITEPAYTLTSMLTRKSVPYTGFTATKPSSEFLSSLKITDLCSISLTIYLSRALACFHSFCVFLDDFCQTLSWVKLELQLVEGEEAYPLSLSGEIARFSWTSEMARTNHMIDELRKKSYQSQKT